MSAAEPCLCSMGCGGGPGSMKRSCWPWRPGEKEKLGRPCSSTLWELPGSEEKRACLGLLPPASGVAGGPPGVHFSLLSRYFLGLVFRHSLQKTCFMYSQRVGGGTNSTALPPKRHSLTFSLLSSRAAQVEVKGGKSPPKNLSFRDRQKGREAEK